METQDKLNGVVKYTNVLKLDFDCIEPEFINYVKRIRTTLRIIGVLQLVDVKVMKTHRGYHVYLFINSTKYKIMSQDVLCIQALMGSDWKRESFNYLRVISKCQNGELLNENWNVLFISKWQTSSGLFKSKETEREDLKSLFFDKNLFDDK